MQSFVQPQRLSGGGIMSIVGGGLGFRVTKFGFRVASIIRQGHLQVQLTT